MHTARLSLEEFFAMLRMNNLNYLMSQSAPRIAAFACFKALLLPLSLYGRSAKDLVI
jgi:hypothetical protein